MNPAYRRTFAEIHLENLRHNHLQMRAMLPREAFYCPMVKADAYGHGALDVVKELAVEGVSHFGVAMIEEGVELREQGVHEPHLLVFGFFDRAGAQVIWDYQLTPVVWSWGQLEALAACVPENGDLPLHLKFNTGMNRLGFGVNEFEALSSWFARHPRFQVEGVCSHLMTGEDLGVEGGQSEQQLNAFAALESQFRGSAMGDGVFFHIYNSAGLLAAGRSRFQGKGWGARPGISLYGYGTSFEAEGWDSVPQMSEIVRGDSVSGLRLGDSVSGLRLGDSVPRLRPVMRLCSEIVAVQSVVAGGRVSYGGTWRANRDSLIGVVAVGYADGYHRLLSNRAQMTVRGQRVSVCGTVCMDYVMIDLTEAHSQSPISVGEPVVVFGGRPGEVGAAELAHSAQTISYELLTAVGRRVPRRVIKGASS